MTLDAGKRRDGDRRRVLIIGASGFVGGHLFHHLSRPKMWTVGTHSTGQRPGFLRFDLVSQRILEVLPPEFVAADAPRVACICAANASVEACGRDPNGAKAVNVSGTIRLIDDLVGGGFRVIFFSTSAVHDGKLSRYDESVPAEPINEYGRQKAQVERYLLSSVPSALVIRLSKAIDLAPAPRNLFTEWERHVAEGKPIQCIIDETFSPTWVADISTAVQELIELNIGGLFHVANAECFTRERLARLFLSRLGREVPLILRNAGHFGFREPRPVSSCLDNRKLLAHVSLRFTPMEEFIDMYLSQRRSPAGET